MFSNYSRLILILVFFFQQFSVVGKSVIRSALRVMRDHLTEVSRSNDSQVTILLVIEDFNDRLEDLKVKE